jgi:hypothetical protein
VSPVYLLSLGAGGGLSGELGFGWDPQNCTPSHAAHIYLNLGHLGTCPGYRFAEELMFWKSAYLDVGWWCGTSGWRPKSDVKRGKRVFLARFLHAQAAPARASKSAW